MNTVNPVLDLGSSAELDDPGCRQRRWWTVIAVLLAGIFFAEAVFAGAMLSGVSWARRAHAATAMMLIASTLTAGLVSTITLRRIPHGLRLGLTLLLLAAATFVQAAVGALSANGANLTWIHVPLGVAAIGLAGLATSGARRLGRETDQ